MTLTCVIRVAAVLLASSAVVASARAADDDSPRVSVADLLVVDCLLPGQIRQLGRRTTYVSPRRPVRTTGRDCQIRGGEYVAFDRADLRTALTVWLPAAQQGDMEASTVVGEIFEKGLGVPADYRTAAEWYEKAASLGDTRARINLAHLYERGLGVARDPAMAMHWYRLAAGLESPIELDNRGLSQADDAEVLRRQVEELRKEAADLRAALGRTQQELNAALDAAQESTAAQPPAPPVEPVEPAETSSSPDDLARIADLSSEIEAGIRRAAELDRLLADSREELMSARAELDAARASQERRESELAAAGASAEEQRRLAAEGAERIAAMERALAQREAEASAQRAQAARLHEQLATVKGEVSTQQARIAELERQLKEAETAKAQHPSPPQTVTGPELAIIEPQLLATRGIEIVVADAGSQAVRQIIGRVSAPAGLMRLAVNDAAVVPNELGVFTSDVAIEGVETTVSVVAIDRQGKRAALEFVLRAREAATRAPAAAQSAAHDYSGIDFGRFHALVIGNDEYQHLPDLKTAVADATEVGGLLESRYGFSTTLVRNASRYDILSALNTLRERMTSDDNLLIYYAGHGELDEINNRAHWLPVDAEPGSSANWISTVAITDILNIMKARQIMLVVDSCYAGALTRSSVARIATGATPEERLQWLRAVTRKRSRTVLTSGGVEPVLDSGGGRHSVFARALLEVLGGNGDVLDGQGLHREVAARVTYAADNVGFNQVPEYAPIRFAGHEAGEFFFVPKR